MKVLHRLEEERRPRRRRKNKLKRVKQRGKVKRTKKAGRISSAWQYMLRLPVLAIVRTTIHRTSSVGLAVIKLDVGAGTTTAVLVSHNLQILMSIGPTSLLRLEFLSNYVSWIFNCYSTQPLANSNAVGKAENVFFANMKEMKDSVNICKEHRGLLTGVYLISILKKSSLRLQIVHIIESTFHLAFSQY